MSFLEKNEKMSEEDLVIIDDANTAMYNMKQWKKLEDKRSENTSAIERGMKLKYPRVTRVVVQNDSITVETELHYFRISRWDDIERPSEPSFKCDIQVKELPDTAEEFMQMKANIMEDRQQIMTAMNYVKFRFPIKRKD